METGRVATVRALTLLWWLEVAGGPILDQPKGKNKPLVTWEDWKEQKHSWQRDSQQVQAQ